MGHHTLGHTIVLLSHRLALPEEVRRYAARFELSMSTDEELMTLVREEASQWSKANNNRPVCSGNRTFETLVGSLRGVTAQDARQLVRGAIWEDGAIAASYLPDINKAKFALMDMEGVLSFEHDTAKFNEAGGLRVRRSWLEEHREVFRCHSGNDGDDQETRLDTPLGIMLLGVQGGGKSLAARAVAGLWALPLLTLDFGSLYNKFFGETERNLREALKLEDMMSPCVLCLDEIEKGMSISDNDQGISKRILGTLLTWMAERNSLAFIVATSNEISQLPPELIRKGRLDEIFFVDLPGTKSREDIFRIHLAKRDESPDDFDLETWRQSHPGFRGQKLNRPWSLHCAVWPPTQNRCPSLHWSRAFITRTRCRW